MSVVRSRLPLRSPRSGYAAMAVGAAVGMMSFGADASQAETSAIESAPASVSTFDQVLSNLRASVAASARLTLPRTAAPSGSTTTTTISICYVKDPRLQLLAGDCNTSAGNTTVDVPQQADTASFVGKLASNGSSSSLCPLNKRTGYPQAVVGVSRWSNDYFGFTSGLKVKCQPYLYDASSQDPPAIGTVGITNGGTTPPTLSRCGTSTSEPGSGIGYGFTVHYGHVIDGIALECATPGSHSTTNYVGGPGGVVGGPALCPKNNMLIGLSGTTQSDYYGTFNVTGLTGVCIVYPSSGGLGAAGPSSVLTYKGKSAKGAATFRMQAKKGTAFGATKAGWDYTLKGFEFATGCSKAKIPGSVGVYARGRKTQSPTFELSSIDYAINGTLSGALDKPKVRGTLKVLAGKCKGKTLRFSATAS
jgi:hypothetical protein